MAIHLPTFTPEPGAVARLRGSLSGGLEGRYAYVPTTRIRAGSAGGDAKLSLQSAESSLGGAGWGGSIEASRSGWGAHFHVAGGSSHGAWGQPQYTVVVKGAAQQDLQLAHEVRWSLSDGQGAWLTVRPTRGGRPRVNLGLEIR